MENGELEIEVLEANEGGSISKLKTEFLHLPFSSSSLPFLTLPTFSQNLIFLTCVSSDNRQEWVEYLK